MIRRVPVAERCGQPLPVRLVAAADFTERKGLWVFVRSALSDLLGTISAAITTAVAVTARNLDPMYG
jgi:hypothetical protein